LQVSQPGQRRCGRPGLAGLAGLAGQAGSRWTGGGVAVRSPIWKVRVAGTCWLPFCCRAAVVPLDLLSNSAGNSCKTPRDERAKLIPRNTSQLANCELLFWQRWGHGALQLCLRVQLRLRHVAGMPLLQTFDISAPSANTAQARSQYSISKPVSQMTRQDTLQLHALTA
jgi:hypothetical protein